MERAAISDRQFLLSCGAGGREAPELIVAASRVRLHAADSLGTLLVQVTMDALVGRSPWCSAVLRLAVRPPGFQHRRLLLTAAQSLFAAS